MLQGVQGVYPLRVIVGTPGETADGAECRGGGY